MVDYCDGDVEDEFHWLEGPYLQKDWTIRDLMAQKLFPRSRTERRRQRRTEFRDDKLLDKQDPNGHPLPGFCQNCRKCMCKHCCPTPQQPTISNLKAESRQVRELDAKPKAETEQEPRSRQKSKRTPRTINTQRPPLLKPTQQVVEDINSTIDSITYNVQQKTNKKKVKPGSTSLMTRTNEQGE
jgi:hypothetical protein